MKVTTLDEKSIRDIGHAFGYYDYEEETGMSAAFSGKEATANYICAYVRGVLRGGFLHTTSERDEATASLDVENETAIQEALSRLIKKQNRPHHCPPDAHRGRCGSGGGAVGRHRGRAGQPGRAVRPEGTVHPHGGSAVGKPELDDLRMRAAFIWEKVLHSVKNCGTSIIRNTILKERSTVQ